MRRGTFDLLAFAREGQLPDRRLELEGIKDASVRPVRITEYGSFL